MDSIKELFPNASVRTYSKNQIICYQGDQPQHVFYVLKGHIKYYDIDENGNEKILHIVGPQNIFPMLYAFQVSDKVDAFYSSLDKVELLSVSLDDFRRVTKTNITFVNSLTRWFLAEIEQLTFRINSFEKSDSRYKVLQALQYLTRSYGAFANGWQRLNFLATQQFLADFTGLTRETVSTTMTELEKTGTVRIAKGRFIEVKSHAEID